LKTKYKFIKLSRFLSIYNISRRYQFINAFSTNNNFLKAVATDDMPVDLEI